MDGASVRVLLAEDDEDDYLLTRKLLNGNLRTRFEVEWARSYDATLDKLRSPGASYDVCLVDYRLGAESGLALIEKAVAVGFSGPIILLTGQGDHHVDVEAMRAGAADYMVKDQITSQLLERVIRHSIERKAADAALRRSEAQLRQSQKMEAIGSLAGGIAHDLNNLLSVILGYGQMLTDDLPPGDPLRDNVFEITGAGLRAADLTRQLLAFSRQQLLQPRIVNLNAVLAGIDVILRCLIGEGVELSVQAAPDLQTAMVDPGQMEQVIMNLAVNARDAMPAGGQLKIETANVFLSENDVLNYTATKPGPHVMLAVTDTGIGMDQATKNRMFEPFFTTKNVGKGTGLGLSTVFGIVKQSGGAIGAWSEPGEGTTFKTFFPIAQSLGNLPLIPREEVVEQATLRGSETVLVVEDEDSVRILACTILRRYGYDVLEAQSGGDALIVSEQHEGTIHLLLADVVMPRMSGPQLTDRLLSVRPDMKVLYMSGHIGGAALQAVIFASHAPFLQKPITNEVLVRRVRDVLGPAAVPILPRA